MKGPSLKEMYLLKEKIKKYFLSPGAVRGTVEHGCEKKN